VLASLHVCFSSIATGKTRLVSVGAKESGMTAWSMWARCGTGVVGGVVGLGIVVGAVITWLVMRKRRIRNSGSSDEESPSAKAYRDNNGFPHGACSSSLASSLQ
jgi:hypothetical protein